MMGAESIDNKLAHLEGSFQQFEKRFDSLERKVDMNFRWTMGVEVTSFVALSGTMISGFVAVLSRLH